MFERHFEGDIKLGTRGDRYVATVQFRGAAGSVALEVELDPERVQAAAHGLRRLLLQSAPQGVDVSGVRQFRGPGYQKLVAYAARRLAAQQLEARALRARMPQLLRALRSPWSTQTADEAYFLIKLARAGDTYAKAALRQLAVVTREEQDPGLQAAMRMLGHLNELAARQSPPPSSLLGQPAGAPPPSEMPGEAALPPLPELPPTEGQPQLEAPVEDDHPDIVEAAEEAVAGTAVPELEHYLVVGRRRGKRKRRRVSSKRAVQLLKAAANLQPDDQGAPQYQDQGAPPDQGQLGDFADQGDPSAPQDGGQGQPQGDTQFADQAPQQ